MARTTSKKLGGRAPEGAETKEGGRPDDTGRIVEETKEMIEDDPAASDPATPPAGSGRKGDIVPYPRSSLVRYDPLQQYMTEIRRHPLLSPDEEYELAVRCHEKGDLKAAHRLVTSNLRLVVKIAMDYRRYWMNLLDLVQEGNMGLMQAVRHYDPYRGVRLSSYSSFWIKAYILKFIIDNWSLVKIGTTQSQRKLFFKLRKEKEKYRLLGYDPDPEKMAEKFKVKPELIVEMDQRLSGGDVSLDQPVGDDSGDRHIDLLADRQQEIDDYLADAEIRELFRSKLEVFRKRLNEKELCILDKRLLSESPETLSEIGDRYGITRERIRQIEGRIIEKLRDYFAEEVPELAGFRVEPKPDQKPF